MNTDKNTEDKLKKLFQAQKAHNEKNIPTINQIINKPSGGAFIFFRGRLALAVCMIFIFLISLPVLTRIKHHNEVNNLQRQNPKTENTKDFSEWENLTNWQASTDTLLSVSASIFKDELKTSTDKWFSDDYSETDFSQ